MQPAIHHFDGIPYVVTPYRYGTYIREDVFWRQFDITCQGSIKLPEDNPVCGGSRWAPHTILLGQHGLIEQAMVLANVRVSQHGHDLSGELDASGFAPERIFIRDHLDRLVLAGQAWDNSVRWCLPVASDDEAAVIAKEIDHLRGGTSHKAGQENWRPSQNLHRRARAFECRLVNRFWRSHARRAIQVTACTC